MAGTFFENGREFIKIDGVQMEIFRPKPKNRCGCANCDWHLLTDEEKRFIRNEMERLAEKMPPELG